MLCILTESATRPPLRAHPRQHATQGEASSRPNREGVLAVFLPTLGHLGMRAASADVAFFSRVAGTLEAGKAAATPGRGRKVLLSRVSRRSDAVRSFSPLVSGGVGRAARLRSGGLIQSSNLLSRIHIHNCIRGVKQQHPPPSPRRPHNPHIQKSE